MDIRSMIFELVGCNYAGPIEEIYRDGVYVKRSKEGMVVGGSTIPEKCRAYMLLAKGLKEGNEEFELEQKAVFSTLGPMLDMSRGGVMKVESVKKYLRYMAAHGMNMLMLYTEDTYEVPEYPYLGYQRGRYTLEELRQVDDYAADLGIEVIPCIQTLGHMEQFLRYSVHSKMKDTKRVLMVGEEETYQFIDACIAVMRKAFRSKRIHIGCDETNGMGSGNYLTRNGYQDRLELFTEHVGRVSEICKKYDFRPMIWSDMYFVYTAKGEGGPDYAGAVIPPGLLKIMPDVDLVYWQYGDQGYDKYKAAIERHKMLKGETMFAGAIWTFEGILPNYKLTYQAMMPALQACVDQQVNTVIATMWSNDGCETSHMLGIPQLALYSEYCYRGADCTEADIWDVAGFVTGITKELADAVSEFFFGYEGAVSAGKAIMWSDPLINLLSYDYDLGLAEQCLLRGLEVFSKYEGVEYFVHVFRATLDKCRLQMQLRDHYKADDRQWLAAFAADTLPEVIADFEKLYQIHREMWCKDYKGNGLERIMIRYAGTMERLRYAKLRIEQYLAGEIEEIEELEPETISVVKSKFMDARDFMLTTTYI